MKIRNVILGAGIVLGCVVIYAYTKKSDKAISNTCDTLGVDIDESCKQKQMKEVIDITELQES